MPSIFDGLAGIFTDVLGQPVTVQPYGKAPKIINAIFGNRSDPLLDMAHPEPVLHAQAADVADLRDGDAVTVDGIPYIARTFEPNGRGMVTVRLERESD